MPAHIHPIIVQFASILVSRVHGNLPIRSLVAHGLPETTEYPESLCLVWALPTTRMTSKSSQKTLLFLHSSYGLMRQNESLPTSRFSLVRWVFAGCRQSLLGNGPSRHYLCNPCVGAWTHTPLCLPSALAHFFPGNIGLTPKETCSAHKITPAMRLPQGAVFRSCSHSFTFRLLRLLDLQVAPTAKHKICLERPGRLHHA